MKELNQEDGIIFIEIIVNYLYDMKDKLIAKGSAKQKIVLDNKIGLTTLDTVAFIKDNIIVSEKGNIVERAKSSVVTKERLISQVKKLGNTPFNSHNIDVIMDDDIFIPM